MLKPDNRMLDFLKASDMVSMLKSESWARALYLIWVPVALLCIYVAYTHYQLGPLQIITGFFAGVFFWTFLEYLIHRFIFHWQPSSKSLKTIVYKLHGKHHEYPTLRNTFMWPSWTVIFGVVGYLLQIVLQIPAGYRELLVAGIAVGFLGYETVHYGTHHWSAHSRLWKFFKRYHALHHYKEANKNYGVTTSLWDHVFGTYMPDPINMRSQS